MRRLVWWWISGLAFLLALVAVLAFFHTGPAPIRGEADQLSSIGNLLIGVAGLLVSIMSLRAARRSDGSDTTHALALTDVADQLAIAVGRQWDAEAKLRRLNDPDPLPVSWEAADPELVEDWSFLAKTASDWPGDPPPDPRGWAAQPSGLAGSNRELSDVLSHRVPTGRLVVLGEPGAGKTILLVRLVLDLLDRRRPGGPVPVLVPLASWNPHEQDLHTWLADRLATDHPGLREPAPATMGNLNRVQALLDSRLLLPILDGLDEMADAVRGSAIAKINDALRPREGLVLSSRVAEYRQAVHPEDGPHVKLRDAAGIVLQQLNPEDIKIYLLHDDHSHAPAERWNPVLEVLGTATPAAQVLRTPLMVGLARTIYNPRPGEHTGRLPDPADLCAATLRTRTDVEKHLFDAFIRAAYRPHPDPTKRCPWRADDAERWLVYLAGHLEHGRPPSTTDLAAKKLLACLAGCLERGRPPQHN